MQNNPLIEKVVNINRVAKVTKGGKKLSFGALVVIGDGEGMVGFGFGKSGEVANAINKGTNKAKKNMFKVTLCDNTIPNRILCDYGATKVLLKPAAKGTGIIASGPIRAICDACGIKDIIAKSIGSNNPVNIVKAVVKGLKTLGSKDEASEPQPETEEVGGSAG